ncbi:hypothetical protein [Dendronalium sp. ChiSLP03b]|nr:hypothetical protein [Dendronalium sp. ChiSLP03b]MDZ8208431.1 hypothetical protein [Dendronalium sp. ChiSLP03b]
MTSIGLSTLLYARVQINTIRQKSSSAIATAILRIKLQKVLRSILAN